LLRPIALIFRQNSSVILQIRIKRQKIWGNQGSICENVSNIMCDLRIIRFKVYNRAMITKREGESIVYGFDAG